MRWRKTRKSGNVEDRRGSGRVPGGKAGLSIGALLVALVGMFLTGNLNLGALLQAGGALAGGAATSGGGSTYQSTPADDEKVEFIRHVLGDTEDTWAKIFRDAGKVYKPAKLVVFHGGTTTACGHAQSATGPFYCPGDNQVYIDLSFFQDLSRRFGAPGDFAQAYVIAHEVAHHVQNLLGLSDMVHQKRRQLPEAQYNRWSVALELQADFLAGVWAHHTQRRGLLEAGDLEEAINCAMRIGDDTLQKRAGRAVRPETFTHGSARERAFWFKKGLETGDLEQGDTFGAMGLMR